VKQANRHGRSSCPTAGTWRIAAAHRPGGLIGTLQGAKYTGAFDAVFIATSMRVIKTPAQAPQANSICERWIAGARRECTDRILIAGRRHLHHVLSEYVDHYNTHRPHRTLSQKPPDGSRASTPTAQCSQLRWERTPAADRQAGGGPASARGR
jgi:hypothetical protein